MISKPDIEGASPLNAGDFPAWPGNTSGASPQDPSQPSHLDALQALIAFSALHEQVRRRKTLAAQYAAFDQAASPPEFEPGELFVLDEVLQLVAERAVAITGADGLAIALAENNEIVLRAAAGTIRPDVGARIDRDSAFTGACFRSAQVVSCHDTETDARVNLTACRRLGARSMIAFPLCGRRRVIGLLEAFSAEPYGFNDSDVRNLSLLAELVLGALKPEDEDRFAQSAQVAETKLETPPRPAPAPPVEPPKVARVAPPAVVARPVVASTVVTPSVKVPPALAPTGAAAPVVRGPAAPVADKKPAAPQVSSAPASAVLNKPAILEQPAEKPLQLEKAAGAETPTAPELNLLQPELASRRPVLLILLVFIVICAAFAGGVWLFKTTQLGNATLRTEKMPVKPSSTSAANQPPAAPVPAVPAGASPANAAADAASDAGEADSVPATPQELSKFPKVSGIRHWSSSDSSTVVLDLEDQVQYEAHRLAGPDRIYFDLRDTQLAPELVGKSVEVGDAFVSRIRVAQPVAGMTRIVLQTKADSTFSVSLEPNPYRLVVEVRKIGATPRGAVNLFPNAADTEKSKLAIVVPPPTKEDIQLRARVPKMRIVVDAGHGGWDLGTVGRRGLLEKDLVLEISQRLGKLLESRLGMEVIYTRPDDNYITLDERASIANQSQADLFVSVHANYSDLPSARGVETYYTNFFSAPNAKDLETRDPDRGKNAGAAVLSPAELHEKIE